ncbi:MAG: hypothetical protein LBJ12_06365 [Oscillospiraceae bacterium]|jgi:hypothetical protein|nr:hypothetical protein [Oscillospiraceae bacterium]
MFDLPTTFGSPMLTTKRADLSIFVLNKAITKRWYNGEITLQAIYYDGQHLKFIAYVTFDSKEMINAYFDGNSSGDLPLISRKNINLPRFEEDGESHYILPEKSLNANGDEVTTAWLSGNFLYWHELPASFELSFGNIQISIELQRVVAKRTVQECGITNWIDLFSVTAIVFNYKNQIGVYAIPSCKYGDLLSVSFSNPPKVEMKNATSEAVAIKKILSDNKYIFASDFNQYLDSEISIVCELIATHHFSKKIKLSEFGNDTRTIIKNNAGVELTIEKFEINTVGSAQTASLYYRNPLGTKYSIDAELFSIDQYGTTILPPCPIIGISEGQLTWGVKTNPEFELLLNDVFEYFSGKYNFCVSSLEFNK